MQFTSKTHPEYNNGWKYFDKNKGKILTEYFGFVKTKGTFKLKEE